MRPQLYITEQTSRKVLFMLVMFEICLVVIYLACGILGEPISSIHKLFNLNGEKNVPALYSAAQLFLVGIVFLSIAFQPRRKYLLSPLFLAILGAGFIFLSFDEALSIHEKITEYSKHIYWIPRFKGNHGIWVAPYLTVGLIFFILTRRNFLRMWNEFNRETRIIGVGLTIFLVGVVGLEVIGYIYIRGEAYPGYIDGLVLACEEFFEMVGISIVLYGALLLRLANGKHQVVN